MQDNISYCVYSLQDIVIVKLLEKTQVAINILAGVLTGYPGFMSSTDA